MLTVVEYFQKKAKLTKNCNRMCSKCVLNKNNNGKNILCVDFEYKYPEVAEEKIEKWWKEEEEAGTKQSMCLALEEKAGE